MAIPSRCCTSFGRWRRRGELKRASAILLGLMLIGSLAWALGGVDQIVSYAEQRQVQRSINSQNEAAFRVWLKEQPERSAQFDALAAFLNKEGVGKVVPIWTLARGDLNRLPWCKGAGFVLPPRKTWANLPPALRLVRDEVIPAVGQVEVLSAFRTPELNKCAHGASQSRHLTFSAMDLIAPDQPDGKTMFAKLCRRWKAAGPASRWGLGAYFDPARPNANKQARFHVDATGWRSWGFSKKSTSSGCKLL
jgi:Peptidase M15